MDGWLGLPSYRAADYIRRNSLGRSWCVFSSSSITETKSSLAGDCMLLRHSRQASKICYFSADVSKLPRSSKSRLNAAPISNWLSPVSPGACWQTKPRTFLWASAMCVYSWMVQAVHMGIGQARPCSRYESIFPGCWDRPEAWAFVFLQGTE